MFQDLKIKICKKCMSVIWSDNDYVMAEWGFECGVCNYSTCKKCDEGAVSDVCESCLIGKDISKLVCEKCFDVADYVWDNVNYCRSCLLLILRD